MILQRLWAGGKIDASVTGRKAGSEGEDEVRTDEESRPSIQLQSETRRGHRQQSGRKRRNKNEDVLLRVRCS